MDKKIEKICAFVETADVVFAVFDDHDFLIYANARFRDIFYLKPDEYLYWPDIMRRNFEASRGTVIENPDFDLWLKSTLSRRGKIARRAFETNTHDGIWLWMTETVDDDGWMLCLATDITPLRARGRDLRQERDTALKTSLTDELTGIANRRFLIECLGGMLDRKRDEVNRPQGCFAILDIDDFKQVNDRFGHAAGDQLLVGFAHAISQLVRRADCFGRLGGEEFGLVLPSATRSETRAILEQMLENTRRQVPFSDYPDFRYSFSAGIAEVLGNETHDEVYRQADIALYRAKRNGKNMIF